MPSNTLLRNQELHSISPSSSTIDQYSFNKGSGRGVSLLQENKDFSRYIEVYVKNLSKQTLPYQVQYIVTITFTLGSRCATRSKCLSIWNVQGKWARDHSSTKNWLHSQ